jgi:hypothetical protein
MRKDRGPMYRNRIVGHGEERPDQLLANPMNWRTHPDSQQDELSKVLETVGWVQQVIVNRRTGHLVDGHLRVMIALRRDEDTVPVSYVDLSPKEEKLVLATLDPLAELAGRDDEKLREIAADVIQEFPDSDIDLDVIHHRKKAPSKGLTHKVNECTCCKGKCKPGCGCYQESV